MAFVYPEVFAIYQPPYRCYGKIIAGRIEMDAFQSFFDVQLSGSAGLVNPVPVETRYVVSEGV